MMPDTGSPDCESAFNIDPTLFQVPAVAALLPPVRYTLEEIGIPRAAFYRWHRLAERKPPAAAYERARILLTQSR
jgi:hypothetical protein